MGRSGQNTLQEESSCCSEGVRSVYTAAKGMFEICPNEQLCCTGLEERSKRYKDLVITDCAPVMIYSCTQGQIFLRFYPYMYAHVPRTNPWGKNEQPHVAKHVTSLLY